ncbi:cytosolic phospholipase A2 gamma [Stegastes partitus]|uniref:Cytosolic phospholipase A2 gamma n=1 Tax=Stegastes partitus TaxID=144197 RepID=A0A3B5BH41_9TELE|nr:PREDICTED: cytosolic phospholipase A2 gamma [Stegastes partitus]
MKTGTISFLVSAAWLLIQAGLAEDVDNMQRNATEKPIRQSQTLCDGEREYVCKRKQIVLESLNSLGINCTEDTVPHIALLASGGGQRAAVGLVGSLSQMEKDNLLDTLLYLASVSGSTWSMANVYSDPQWSSNVDEAVSKLSGDGVELEEALAWLSARAKEEYFSLTDVWAVLTSAGIMKQMDLRRLSDEADRNATNPYPVYCAIEKHCFSNGPTEGKWFEVTPHEAGFTELGVFVETSLLGSIFQSGKLLEKKPEMDMVKLQGVLGSALADEDTARDVMPAWLTDFIDDAAQEYLLVYNVLNKLTFLTRGTVKDPLAHTDLDNLQKILKDMVNYNQSTLLRSRSSEERKDVFKQLQLEMHSAVQNWSLALLDGPFKRQVSALIKEVIPLIAQWEWGTTRNFLYKYEEPSIPTCLHNKEKLHLIDAGLLINVGYPSFLGDKRDIDLIIVPEYSGGKMFETLTLARDYAAELKKPFPEINDTIVQRDREWPKDCYVFEGGEEAPTIVYMPLFNRQNCKDAEEYQARKEEYATFQLPYNQEKIDFVLETAKANMKNNKDKLLSEMQKAALRRQNKKKSVVQQKLQSCFSGLL